MPRLFVALEMPSDVALSLSLLRGGLPGAKWMDTEKYHLTLRFIGDIDAHMADELFYTLDHVQCPEFSLQLSGMGAFGSKKPRYVWAGVNAPQELYTLQSAIERQCTKIGLKPESRKFTPHITLASVKGADRSIIGQYLGARGNFKSKEFKVGNFVIMSSRNSTGGGPYVVEETYPLAENYQEVSFSNNLEQPLSSIW